MKKEADVSIIMGIYNCANTLEESIESIIKQTYENWELIMCDDGSTDNTYQIAQKYLNTYQDKIHLIKNEKNEGLALSLNRCLKHANGTYIARQDGDDISLPERLQIQVEFLKNNPQYTIVSSGMILFDENGKWGAKDNVEIPEKVDYVKETPFAHAPSVFYKAAITSVGGYRNIAKTLRVEDYDLWFRMREKGYIGYNLNERLYMARDDRNAMNRRKFKYRVNESIIKFDGYRRLKIPFYLYIHALKPIIVGLIPLRLYNSLRRIKHKN